MVNQEDVIAKFPMKILPRIEGEPTHEPLREMYMLLCMNTATLDSTLGGAQNGHVGMLMEMENYAIISSTPYIIPTNPGPEPAFPTTKQKVEQSEFTKYINMNDTLKAQIIEAVDEVYLAELYMNYVGYRLSSAWDMIQHLLARYANITPSDLKANKEKMEETMDPSAHFLAYVKKWKTPYSFQRKEKNHSPLNMSSTQFI